MCGDPPPFPPPIVQRTCTRKARPPDACAVPSRRGRTGKRSSTTGPGGGASPSADLGPPTSGLPPRRPAPPLPVEAAAPAGASRGIEGRWAREKLLRGAACPESGRAKTAWPPRLRGGYASAAAVAAPATSATGGSGAGAPAMAGGVSGGGTTTCWCGVGWGRMGVRAAMAYGGALSPLYQTHQLGPEQRPFPSPPRPDAPAGPRTQTGPAIRGGCCGAAEPRLAWAVRAPKQRLEHFRHPHRRWTAPRPLPLLLPAAAAAAEGGGGPRREARCYSRRACTRLPPHRPLAVPAGWAGLPPHRPSAVPAGWAGLPPHRPLAVPAGWAGPPTGRRRAAQQRWERLAAWEGGAGTLQQPLKRRFQCRPPPQQQPHGGSAASSPPRRRRYPPLRRPQ